MQLLQRRQEIVKAFILIHMFIWTAGITCAVGQVKTPFLVQTTLDDEWITLSVDKVVYFAGDTVHLVIQRTDSVTTSKIVPVLPIEGAPLKPAGRHAFIAILPQNITPGPFVVNLRVQDAQGRRYWYKTDCTVTVEEHQEVALLRSFVHLAPVGGGENTRTADALDREVIQNLEVQFMRDSIMPGMGPQFITIRTTLIPRNGGAARSLERRVVTFRSHGDLNKDRLVFIQYRNAYSRYAVLSPEEADHVRLPVDSLPDWALLIVQIEPDYSIKIGAVDRSNTITKYYRVRGPSIEIGFLIGVPKVLFDSRADDPIEYGNTTAMVRAFYVSEKTGNRFPLNAGIGTFGVNSPIDVGIGKGGFALSVLLDLAEMIRILDINFTNKVNIGLEFTHLLSIDKKGRFLLDTQVSLAL